MRRSQTTITHRNGGLEQGILEAVKKDGLLSQADERRLEQLKKMPPDRTELLTPNVRTDD